MAVSENLVGIKVTVRADEQPLEEYPAENDEIVHGDEEIVAHQKACTITKYVESIANKTFSVRLRVHESYAWDCSILSFEVYLDGMPIDSPLVERAWFAHATSWQEDVEGRPNGRDVRLMKFAEIKTTCERLPNRVIEEHTEALDNVGEIKVLIYRESAADPEDRERSVSPVSLDFEETYHLKACVKGNITHGARLSDAKLRRKAAPTKHVERLDGVDKPIGIFKFKYRSKDALKQLLVIPRTPSPEPAVEHEPTPKPESSPEPDPIVRRRLFSSGGRKVSRRLASPEINPVMELEHMAARIRALEAQLVTQGKEPQSIRSPKKTRVASNIGAVHDYSQRVKRERPNGGESAQPPKRSRRQTLKTSDYIDLTGDSENEA